MSERDAGSNDEAGVSVDAATRGIRAAVEPEGEDDADGLGRVLRYRPSQRTVALEMFLRGFHATARGVSQTQTLLGAYGRLADLVDGVLEAIGSGSGVRDRLAAERGSLKNLVASSSRMYRRRVVIDSVDNYLSYLADMAALVMRRRPETLRAHSEVLVADVLVHESMDEFVEWLSEREVARLTMRGLPDVADHFDRRFGLAIARTASDIELLKCATLVRNLFTHRRGVVDERFLTAMRSFPAVNPGAVGELWEVPKEFATRVLVAAVDAVAHIEQSASLKFGLERIEEEHGPQCWGCEGVETLRL